MEYSKPRNKTGNWDIDYEPNDEDEVTGDNLQSLTLMRDNKNVDEKGNPCYRQMLTELDASLPQDDIGENNLRLIISAPKMYEALLELKKQLALSDKSGCFKISAAQDLVDDALDCAEKFEFPWESAED